MKRVACALLALACALTLALGGCAGTSSATNNASNTNGGTSSDSNLVNGIDCSTKSQTIVLDAESFDQFCYTVIANQPVTFTFPTAADTSGVIHIICSGVNEVCATDPNAPKDLAAPGFTIKPGEQRQVTFTTPGVYNVTCTLHPMTVQIVAR